MRKLLLLMLPAVACFAQTQSAVSSHVMLTPNQIKWEPAPPSFPLGASIAVLAGDPSKPGAPYSVQFKLPNGYKIAPHWHPRDENVVVLKGTFLLGMGDKFDTAAGRAAPVGSYVLMPKEVRHFGWAKGETVLQIYGVGPLEIIYVNPADDPRKKTGSQ